MANLFQDAQKIRPGVAPAGVSTGRHGHCVAGGAMDELHTPTEIAPGNRTLFISPHLDDAVFACGRLLASLPGATVATVFAGAPPPEMALTDWDRAAGFGPGDDIIGRRRDEDRRALAVFDARPLWLDLRDAQYGPSPGVDEVAARLRALLAGCLPAAAFLPLGLFHSDHRLSHAAALQALEACPGCRAFAYEDAFYRRLSGLRRERLETLRQAGRRPRPVWFVESREATERKEAAVACYRSQLRALTTPGRPGLDDLAAPEAFWRLG